MEDSDDLILQEVIEDRLLRVNARLHNGTQAKVFSVLPTERGPRWRCHACQVTVFGSREIYKHERSKEHAKTMVEKKTHPPENFHVQSPPPPPHQTLLEMSLAPGEPVPPGFEGEVRGVAEIQNKLDAITVPLIGLEYLFELHSYDDKEPHYICILCDKRGDPRTVMAHLNSFNHRLKYIESHFQKVTQKMVKNRSSKEYKKVCQPLIATLAEWIEKRFGRLAPHACDRDSFERKREIYTQTVVKDVHFCDKYGETLEEFVTDEMFESKDEDKPEEPQPIATIIAADAPMPGCKPPLVKIKRRSPSPPIVNAPGFKKQRQQNTRPFNRRSDKSPLSSVSSVSLSDSSPEHQDKMKHNNTQRPNDQLPRSFTRSRSRSNSRSRVRRYKYSRSRSRSLSPLYDGPKANYHPGIRFPWRRPDYVQQRQSSDVSLRKKISAETARWEEFRKGVTNIENELNHVLKNHEKNPEKHPAYPEEWKKFWNRRYKELQAEHKDPSKHDFKPEWIDFWNKRMREMHELELKSRKDALRKRLNLPEEPQPIKFKITSKKQTGNTPNVRSAVSSDEVIVIDDGKDDDVPPTSSQDDRRVERKRSHSPWEADYPSYERERYIPKRDYYGKVRIPSSEQHRYQKIVHAAPKSKPYMFEREHEVDDETQLNIVAVLRLITALEEKLGSLGPKVIEMLSTALAMEKKEANSAERLLDDDKNCVLFETVKEKLKGQLLAGMIEYQAEKPAKNAVKRIASLLHMASERKRKAEEEMKLLGKTKPLSVPGIGEVDKEAIAKQITTALLKQGRTNVTQEELEQLISAVVGMAQAKSTGQQVTAAEYATKIQSDKDNIKTKSSTTILQTLQTGNSSVGDTSAMEGLSDSDLKTLLQNFKDLSTDEQHGLIQYLKKLEALEPERVERLRKFVNLDSSKSNDNTDSIFEEKSENKSSNPKDPSPVVKKNDVVDITEENLENNSKIPAQQSGFVNIDSEEDDDYTYEDVFKAASNNLKEKQLAEEKDLLDREIETRNALDPNVVLKDAKIMIANIMGKLGQKNASANIINEHPNPVGPVILSNELVSPSRFENNNSRYSSFQNMDFPSPINEPPFNSNFSNQNFSNPNSSIHNTPSFHQQRPSFNPNNYQETQPFKPNTMYDNNLDPFRSGGSGNQSYNQYNQYDQFNIPPSQQPTYSHHSSGGFPPNNGPNNQVSSNYMGVGGQPVNNYVEPVPPPQQMAYGNPRGFNSNNNFNAPPQFTNRGFY